MREDVIANGFTILKACGLLHSIKLNKLFSEGFMKHMLFRNKNRAVTVHVKGRDTYQNFIFHVYELFKNRLRNIHTKNEIKSMS
jgi:hypothetical protein